MMPPGEVGRIDQKIIHRSAWKRNSRKFVSRILHSSGPIGGAKLPTRPWSIEVNTTYCGAGWICAKVNAREGHRPRSGRPPPPWPLMRPEGIIGREAAHPDA